MWYTVWQGTCNVYDNDCTSYEGYFSHGPCCLYGKEDMSEIPGDLEIFHTLLVIQCVQEALMTSVFSSPTHCSFLTNLSDTLLLIWCSVYSLSMFNTDSRPIFTMVTPTCSLNYNIRSKIISVKKMENVRGKYGMHPLLSMCEDRENSKMRRW